MKKSRFRPEVLVIALLVIVSIAVILIMYLGRTPGGQVVVHVDGQETARYSLFTDGEYPLNGGSNTLVVSEGVAYIEWANCPDKYCVKQGRIAYEGQCITCLPNRLTVTVEGVKADIPIDLVS